MARRDPVLEAIEETLIEAWELLRCSPDRERGFLASGSRSGWPEIVRDKIMDYADTEAQPRLQMTRREVGLRDQVFVNDDCLIRNPNVVADDMPLLLLVLSWKARGRQVDWAEVYVALRARESGVASKDALRVRYDRLLRRLAVLWDNGAAARDAAFSGPRWA